MAAAEFQKPFYSSTAVPPQPNPYPTTYYYQYPPPPPPPPPPHSRRNCPCCLLSTFLKFLVGILTVFVAVVVVLWIVFRPNPLKVHVESANLATFNLTSYGSLRHNLTAEVSIRNPNERVSISYDWLEAEGYYDGQWFQWTRFPRFHQGRKNTTVVRAELVGETSVNFGSKEVRLFDRQREAGKFDVEVRMYARVRYQAGSITTRAYRLRIKCWLPSLSLRGATKFPRTKCKVNY